MKGRYALFLKLFGGLFALALLAVPSLSSALVIVNQVRVVITNGNPPTSQEYCSNTAVPLCNWVIWNLPAGGLTLTAGQTLILTQTGLGNQLGGENFDTSERAGINTNGVPVEIGCSSNPLDGPPTPCTTQIFINGVQVYTNTTGVGNPLVAFNEEPFSNVDNPLSALYQEDERWVTPPAFTGPNYKLQLGYADNIHAGTCTSAGCFPQDNWCTSPNGVPTQACPLASTWFVGAGIGLIGNCGQLGFPGQVGVMHPTTDNNNKQVGCYDAGALLITSLPSPKLSVVKSPKAGTFTQGSQVSFTVVVTNSGEAGSIAHNVQLTDALPGNGGLVWQTANPTAGTCVNPIAGNNLQCSLGDIAAGSSVTVTITSTATTPPAACQNQPNPAAIATDAEGDTAQDSGSLTCTPVPHLKVVKTPDVAPPATNFTPGGPVSFAIVVSNDGQAGSVANNVQLSDQLPTNGGLNWFTAGITVNPAQGTCSINASSVLSCNLGSIAAGNSVTVTVSLPSTPVAACQNQPNPAANATANGGLTATDSGGLNCTASPAITIKKFTNGADANNANDADVPNVAVGGAVTWRYEVKNTGNVPVAKADVVVTDDHAGVSPQPVLVGAFVQGDTNTNNVLDPGETWIYQATGIALNLALTPLDPGKIMAGVCTHNGTQPPRTGYVNQGKVTIPNAPPATDPSAYCNPPNPSVAIKKLTNGADANNPNDADVPNIPVGGAVTWRYEVTNTGNVPVAKADVAVTDDHAGVSPQPVLVGAFVQGDTNTNNVLDPGETWIYQATGIALNLVLTPLDPGKIVAGVCTHNNTEPPRTGYVNQGKVTIPNAPPATDPSSYCNPPNPAVTIIKFTNGADANDPNAAGVPVLAPGAAITWTYRVTNTGNTNVAKADVLVTDNTTGVTPTFTSEITGNGDNTFNPGEVWLYSATGTALDLTLAPPSGVHTVPNSCSAGGTVTPSTAYTNVGTVTIPGDSDTDPSSYCNPPPLSCPAGSFTYSVDANGNLNIVFDQFPAPNDNSYGVNAVGWGTKGHKFSDLVGSDHAGFQIVNPSGTVVLDFNIDYITAVTPSAAFPSGYKSYGPFGGDGKVNVGSLIDQVDITYTSSLAKNLNNVNIPGLFSNGVQLIGTGVANVLVDSPPTLDTISNYTLTPPAAAVFTGWDFHDTYFVTLNKVKLQAIGFLDAAGNPVPGWKVQPNLDALHNSPAKPCPNGPGGTCDLAAGALSFDKNKVKLTITNDGTADAILSNLALTWPAANGKLKKISFDGDVIYDNPDIAPPSANLSAAQLGDAKKRTIAKNSSDVVTLEFEKDASKTAANYAGTFTFGNGTGCVVSFGGATANACVLGYPFASSNPKTSVIFNESEVLQAFDPAVATSLNDTVRLFAADEHAMLLGVRTAAFPVSAMSGNPGHVVSPLVGDKTITDPSGRPIFPSIYLTDVTGITDTSTSNLAYRAGDWQYGGTPVAPSEVFGTWKGASKSGTTLTTDADPAKNTWNLGPGSDTPSVGFSSLVNQGYGTEVRWNLSSLTVGGQPLQSGHTYRVQYIVHDGDQNKTGGDVGQACSLITIP